MNIRVLEQGSSAHSYIRRQLWSPIRRPHHHQCYGLFFFLDKALRCYSLEPLTPEANDFVTILQKIPRFIVTYSKCSHLLM